MSIAYFYAKQISPHRVCVHEKMETEQKLQKKWDRNSAHRGEDSVFLHSVKL